jgi:hypothetical protein
MVKVLSGPVLRVWVAARRYGWRNWRRMSFTILLLSAEMMLAEVYARPFLH